MTPLGNSWSTCIQLNNHKNLQVGEKSTLFSWDWCNIYSTNFPHLWFFTGDWGHTVAAVELVCHRVLSYRWFTKHNMNIAVNICIPSKWWDESMECLLWLTYFIFSSRLSFKKGMTAENCWCHGYGIGRDIFVDTTCLQTYFWANPCHHWNYI